MLLQLSISLETFNPVFLIEFGFILVVLGTMIFVCIKGIYDELCYHISKTRARNLVVFINIME